MITVSTHQRSEPALAQQALPVRRIGPRFFGALLVAEALLLIAVGVWALFWLTPSATPYASNEGIAPVSEAIRARLSGAQNDPLVEVQPGLSVHASNLRGFSLGGEVYYYYLEGARNYDPLSRGEVRADQVEILLRDESGPYTLVIYRIS